MKNRYTNMICIEELMTIAMRFSSAQLDRTKKDSSEKFK